MNKCVDLFEHNDVLFALDSCNHTLSYSIDNSILTSERLIELSEECYSLYSDRLLGFDKKLIELSEWEYRFINKKIIDLISPFDPTSFSFSITYDPSLHFFVRFSNSVSLAIETFIDLEEGSDVYLQLAKGGDVVVQMNSDFHSCMVTISDFLQEEFSLKAIFSEYAQIESCAPVFK